MSDQAAGLSQAQASQTDNQNQEISHEDKVKELEAKCEEYLKGWQRARADYENLKKDTAKSLTELKKYLQIDFIVDLLPVYDHYKLALSHIPGEQQEIDWVQGILYIQREFTDFLKQAGVEEIPTLGQQFDPNLHEAVATEQSPEAEGQIIKEIKAGYRIGEIVLRPAQVIVSKPADSNLIINESQSPENQASGSQ